WLFHRQITSVGPSQDTIYIVGRPAIHGRGARPVGQKCPGLGECFVLRDHSQRGCRSQAEDFDPMLGGDDIINDNERFNPTAGCGLEGPNKIVWAMHWKEQELEAELPAGSFY